jgi:Ca2+-transporting ATPase
MLGVALFQGALAFALLAGLLTFTIANGYGDDRARTIVFSSLVLVNVGLVLANRSTVRTAWAMLRVPNPALWWIVGAALGMLLLSLSAAPVRGILHFGVPSGLDVALVLATAGVALLGFELPKAVGRPHRA